PDGQELRANDLVLIHNVGSRNQSKTIYTTADDKQFPKGYVLSEYSRLSFSKDDQRVFLGVKKQQEKRANPKGDLADVDVWHWEDTTLQSIQKIQANREKRKTDFAVFNTKTKAVTKLGSDKLVVSSAPTGKWAIGQDNTPYAMELSWITGRSDYYKVDPDTGKKSLISLGISRPVGNSPDGRYFLFMKGQQLWAYDLDNETKTDIAKVADVSFANVEDDHPHPKGIYGLSGWSADGKSVIVNHKFDLWVLALDGSSARNLTEGYGEKNQIRLKYHTFDRQEEGIDLDKPIYLTGYGEWTKKTGFYIINKKGSSPIALIDVDAQLGRPVKAKNVDKVILTKERFDLYPDYYVTNTHFENLTKVTDANPQLKELSWGKSILVNYTNKKGQKLQATLAIPDSYQPGDKLPMLVHFYEKRSQNHHRFSSPRFSSGPQLGQFVSRGYMVLQPDIVYGVGTPGDDGVDCVTSAVQAVIDLGYADPQKIAAHGHSWGGYQTSYMLTQTDMFCSVVTGAPLTNLMSMYNILYKRSGVANQGILQYGQGRMGESPWDNFELYTSQSPVHHVKNINTPFIILHGTADGAVDWNQGLEFYTAARMHGKEAILLSYPDEFHSLRKLENQKDFLIRIEQFFDHYCFEKPAPTWMSEGQPFLGKQFAKPTDGMPKKKN
ncbi:MAG: prolyl oligopeptidase family serine peptidase, partial [Pirellulaceae bacterium]|nr:prolyl oligopeptidase family serine peptidase [Pirellulaceae bacterium]